MENPQGRSRHCRHGLPNLYSYLDNLLFLRGMRQSLMDTFNEIYILDLHGNSLKEESSARGRKRRKMFSISAQGVAIALSH